MPGLANAIDRTLLNLLRRAHTGSPIPHALIERRWRITGFRQDDLRDALIRLESMGRIRFENRDAPDSRLVLLSTGFRWAEMLRAPAIWWWVRGARRPTGSTTAPGLHRRAGDHKAGGPPASSAAPRRN